MSRITGIYCNGKVVLDQPVDWPEGMSVCVLSPNGAKGEGLDFNFDGSPCEETPEALQRWAAWFDSLEPVLSGEDLEHFEADLRSARKEQQTLLPSWQKRIDDLTS